MGIERLEAVSIEINREPIELKPFRLDTDAQWIDSAGHAHRIAPRTYLERPTGRFNEEGEEYREPVCPLCGERLELPVKWSDFREFERGNPVATVTYVDGATFTLTDEQLSDLMKLAVTPPEIMPALAARWRLELEGGT